MSKKETRKVFISTGFMTWAIIGYVRRFHHSFISVFQHGYHLLTLQNVSCSLILLTGYLSC